jgi:nucleoid DNA-binding protein
VRRVIAHVEGVRDVAITGFGKFSVTDRAAPRDTTRERRDGPDCRQPRREVLAAPL